MWLNYKPLGLCFRDERCDLAADISDETIKCWTLFVLLMFVVRGDYYCLAPCSVAVKESTIMVMGIRESISLGTD